VAQVACALTIGERAAAALLGESHALATSLPAALDALQTGAIGWQHARTVVDETAGLTPAAVSALEAHFFGPDAGRGAAPGELVPARFRRKLRAWRERHHPESLEERHAKSVADRRVEFSPDRDGMAWLSLYLPGDTALAVWNKSTALARGLQGPREPRNLSQLGADIAAGLLLGSANQDVGDVPSPKADVLVTVPVLSFLGITDEPAEIDGLGPVPPVLPSRAPGPGTSALFACLSSAAWHPALCPLCPLEQVLQAELHEDAVGVQDVAGERRAFREAVAGVQPARGGEVVLGASLKVDALEVPGAGVVEDMAEHQGGHAASPGACRSAHRLDLAVHR
jgi:hypothetical protein